MEYESHKAASLAKRRLSTGRIKVWGCDIIVDWADPQEEPDEQTMSKVNDRLTSITSMNYSFAYVYASPDGREGGRAISLHEKPLCSRFACFTYET